MYKRQLVPRAEIEGEMGDSFVGLHARLMSQALRKLAGAISKSNCVVIFINQLREKVGVVYGNPEVTTGGRALKFYSSVRIEDVYKRQKGYGRYLKEVSYPRCQNNGARAIALSWGMEDDSASGMSVHTLGSDGLNEALAVRYSNSYIVDVNYDGVDEIFLTAFDRVSSAMVMTAYGFRNGECTEISQTPLSSDVKTVVKITKSTKPGQWGLSLYVDSLAATGGYITDIVELRSGVLTNTTLGSGSKMCIRDSR